MTGRSLVRLVWTLGVLGFVPSGVLAQPAVDGSGRGAGDSGVVSGRNRPPLADAGAGQTVATSTVVRLDGSRSTDADGDSLAFSWRLMRRPALSQARLSSVSAVSPTFVVDVPGTYVARLVTHDGVSMSRAATVTIDTRNSAPVASAGPDRTVAVGSVSRLSAAGSSDVDGDELAYAWSLQSAPRGSRAVLSNATGLQTAVVVDRPGRYIARLVVSDGLQHSAPAYVVVDTRNSAPAAIARAIHAGDVASTVRLDGSGSTDVDGDGLSYAWALTARPPGSRAAISNSGSVVATFVADVAGTYVAQLTASDGTVESASVTVAITAAGAAPTAVAGAMQTVAVGQVAVLDGSASTDPDGAPLSYRWAFVSRPADSTATLLGSTGPQPTFIVDRPGAYAVQLIVSDGTTDSAPSTTVVGTLASPPVAAARLNPAGPHGPTVGLDASLSFDPDGGPLTYAWSMLSRPVGSAAQLSNATAVDPTFTIDRPGPYVVQLVVNDGTEDSTPVTLLVDLTAASLVSHAGPDQVADVGATVQLDGSRSLAPFYSWSFASTPAGSAATIVNPTAVAPTFVVDKSGDYVVQLVVSDGNLASAPDTMVVSTSASGLFLAPSGLALSPGGAGVLTVTFTGAAGGLSPAIVLTSSNPAVASVPAEITIPPGQSSAPIPVTAGISGGAVITASINGQRQARAVVAVGGRLVEWISDTSGSWDDPAKWSINAVPAAGDVVLIDRPDANVVVTVPAATAAVQTLFATESLVVTGTLTVAGDGVLARGVTLSGAMTGTGKVTLAGPSTWDGGTVALTGGLEVLAGQTLTLATAGQHVLSSGSLTNHGTVQWTNGELYIQNSIDVLNASDGVWEVQGNFTLSSTQCGAPTFTNAGVLRKTAGTGRFLVSSCVVMTNTGTLEMQAGYVQFAGVLVTSGQLTAAAGTSFLLNQVTLQAGTTFSGAGTLNMDGTTTVTGAVTTTLPVVLLGTVTGSGKLTLAAPMTWDGGTVALTGGLEVLAGQTLTLATAGQHVLSSGSLTNHGTVQWTNGELYIQNSIDVLNASDGVWEVQGNFTLSSTQCGAPTFTNAGVLRKTAGTGRFLVSSCVVMTNTGTLEMQTGYVQFAGVLVTSGQLTAAAGTSFLLNQVTLQAGTTFSGAGTLNMDGTTTVTGAVTTTLPVVLLGTVTGSGKLTLAAPMTWDGGTVALTGGLEVLAGQTLTLATAGQHVLSSGSLTNHGTVLWTNGELYIQNSIDVLNASDGVWEVQGNFTLSSTQCGAPTFTNAGVLRKTAGTGRFLVSSCVVMTNTGTLEMQTGYVQFAGVLVTSGQLTAAAGTSFLLNQVTLQAGTTFSGAGTLNMDGTTTVTGAVTTTLPVVLLGTVTGSGKLTLAAPMTWDGGTVALTGGLEVLAGQTLTLATAGQHVLTSGPLTNHGTVLWTNGELYIQNSIDVLNASDGVWEVQGNFTLSSTQCGAPTFTNAGLLRMSGATRSLSVGSCVTMTNTNIGTIQLRLGGTGAGQFDRILSTNTFWFDGTLDVLLTNGFTPASGDSFAVVTYPARGGAFAVINGNGETYTPTYGASQLTLQK